MIGNFKDIHIGELIAQRMKECNIELERVANFLDVSEQEVEAMYTKKSLDSEVLLRWSKLLKYDFFRIYTQHLILYAPQSKLKKNESQSNKTALPVLKKNIYTPEIIDYLVSLVNSGKKTMSDIQNDYNIPKTTIFRWVDKYNKKNNEHTQ